LKGESTPPDAGVIKEDDAGRVKDVARSFSPELRSPIRRVSIGCSPRRREAEAGVARRAIGTLAAGRRAGGARAANAGVQDNSMTVTAMSA
jgi:hypothetical protein